MVVGCQGWLLPGRRTASDLQVLAREMVVETEHPVTGRFRTLGVSLKLSETLGSVRRPAPASWGGFPLGWVVQVLTWTSIWSIWGTEAHHTLVQVQGDAMEISVTEAKGRLTDLVRRAEAGDEIVLTRHGQPAVRLAPVKSVPDRKARRKLLEAVRRSGRAKAIAGTDAARSQDFLYSEDGLPE